MNGQLTQCMSLAFGLAQIMHACSDSAANVYASRQVAAEAAGRLPLVYTRPYRRRPAVGRLVIYPRCR